MSLATDTNVNRPYPTVLLMQPRGYLPHPKTDDRDHQALLESITDRILRLDRIVTIEPSISNSESWYEL